MSSSGKRETGFFFKLVRDRIPEVIATTGKPFAIHEAHGTELRRALGLKLLEEAHELFRAWHCDDPENILNEAADLLEITLRLVQQKGFSLDELLRARSVKRLTHGGFDRNIILEYTGSPAPFPVQADFPRLLFIPLDHATLIELIKALFLQSTKVSIASAFYTPAVTNLLLKDLVEFTQRGGCLRILLSTMGNLNRPEHLEQILYHVPGANVRVFHPPDVPLEDNPPNFHAKAYLFERDEKKGSLILGSSNFTQGGFFSNIEWNYFSSMEINLPFDGCFSPFDYAKKEFDRMWNEFSVELNEQFLQAYRKRYQPSIFIDMVSAKQAPFASRKKMHPNAAQQEALERLASLRAEGVQQAAVVAATGLGKTYLAAFDFRQSGFQKLLFIAHRENILSQARRSFSDVLGHKDLGTILGGGNSVDHLPDIAFAMIQTLSRPEHLSRFPRDHFDYIVVDEFHHAAATSYARVLEHFRPRFLLGLTATPERTDGQDVLRLCNYNIAYEVRLIEAVDRGWLTPFQYYAIYDPTDYEQIPWRGSFYDERKLEEALSTDTRTQIVAHNLRKFLPSNGKMKALVFCSTIAHAKYTARTLSAKHGIEAVYLVGEHSPNERQLLIDRLQNENDPLNVICCVDVFNEGIDIPNLSHVVLLRPTQSFTLFLQQIGRGLRRAPGKDFTVIIDFVGNFRRAHIAPLALIGYTSLAEAIDELPRLKQKPLQSLLPASCFLDADLEAQRIWDREIRQILEGVSRRDRLKAWYLEIRENLGDKSPQLMDLIGVSGRLDPKAFVIEFGSWLRAKLFCEGTLPDNEKILLDTPGEAFLRHLETELSPTRSYKMVVLKVLLQLPGTRWSVDEIAEGFLKFYLQNRDMIFDYDALANASNAHEFPLRKVRSHILNMPLKYLSNTDKDWFVLESDKTFRLKDEVTPYWEEPFYRELVEDRTTFELTRYFQRRRLRQNIPYDTSLLEWGCALEPRFAEHIFYRKQKGVDLRSPLEPGEARMITLIYEGQSYEVRVLRPDESRHYRLVYKDVEGLLQAMQKRFAAPPRIGQRVFVLTRKGGVNSTTFELLPYTY